MNNFLIKAWERSTAGNIRIISSKYGEEKLFSMDMFCMVYFDWFVRPAN